MCPLPAVYFRVCPLLQCSMVSTSKRFAEVPSRASPRQLEQVTRAAPARSHVNWLTFAWKFLPHLHSADAETGAKVRWAAGDSQEGARGAGRAAEAQACCGGLISCSSSRLWYRPAVSGPFPPQLLHPHRTGAVEPATAAAPAAPDGATEAGGGHATVRLPAPPAGKPRARAAALCLPMCAPLRTACTRNLHPAALWGRLLRRLRQHRSCPPRRPRSSPPRRSGRCLPAAAHAPSHAHAHARPAFDPATAAVRRCRIGWECRRCWQLCEGRRPG